MLFRSLPSSLIMIGLLWCFTPASCLAADDSRPLCSSQNHGQLWPEAANHDPKVLASLMRCGELYICVHGTWHYHWEATSIRLDQLGSAKTRASKPAACEVEPAGPPSQANDKLQ
jgi:hypothetical protein